MQKLQSLLPRNYHNALLIVAVLFSAGFITGRIYELSLLKLVCKPSVLLTYMAYMLLRANFKNTGVYCIFGGHVFSLIGDIVLELDFNNAFTFGLLSFLIGHIFYVTGFLISSPKLEIKSLITNWIPSLVWVMIVLPQVYFRLGYMVIPVLVYSLALTILWMAGSYIIKYRSYMGTFLQYSPFIGALMFNFSDALIALSEFRPEVFALPITNHLIIISYWVAQLCISLTAINLTDTCQKKGKVN